MTSLTSLQLLHNEISGSIPSELGLPTNLIQLLLSYNSLSGLVPSELGNLQSLTDLQLRFNNDGLSGIIPVGVCESIYLSFDCNEHQLCGCLGRPYNQCPCSENITQVVESGNLRG